MILTSFLCCGPHLRAFCKASPARSYAPPLFDVRGLPLTTSLDDSRSLKDKESEKVLVKRDRQQSTLRAFDWASIKVWL